MNDRFLIGAFGTSLLIHLGLLPILALLPQRQSKVQMTIPIELVDAPKIADIRKTEIAVPAPTPQPKLAKITAPKLLSKPTIFETPPTTPIGNTKQEIKEPEKLPEPPPTLAALPESAGSVRAGWNVGNKSPDAEGSAAGAGIFLAAAMSELSAAAVSKAAVAARVLPGWVAAAKATAPAAAESPQAMVSPGSRIHWGGIK